MMFSLIVISCPWLGLAPETLSDITTWLPVELLMLEINRSPYNEVLRLELHTQ